jgi:hypothetical protein
MGRPALTSFTIKSWTMKAHLGAQQSKAYFTSHGTFPLGTPLNNKTSKLHPIPWPWLWNRPRLTSLREFQFLARQMPWITTVDNIKIIAPNFVNIMTSSRFRRAFTPENCSSIFLLRLLHTHSCAFKSLDNSETVFFISQTSYLLDKNIALSIVVKSNAWGEVIWQRRQKR